MGKGADGVIRIPCKADGNFFKYWFEFLQPFHNLTEREMEVITAFVRIRHKLSKVITDPEVLDQILDYQQVLAVGRHPLRFVLFI